MLLCVKHQIELLHFIDKKRMYEKLYNGNSILTTVRYIPNLLINNRSFIKQTVKIHVYFIQEMLVIKKSSCILSVKCVFDGRNLVFHF